MILLKTPGDGMSYRVYVDNIGAADIVTASFSDPELSFSTATPDNTTTPKSVVVRISGGVHGRMYQPSATFQLTTGGPLVRPVAVRVLNG
jgi:predicted aminopeptidase